MTTRSGPGPLLSIRTTLVLLLAALVGLGAAGLSLAAGEPWATAALTGLGGAGGALLLFHALIG